MKFVQRRINGDASHDVTSTLVRRCMNVMCLLGTFRGSNIIKTCWCPSEIRSKFFPFRVDTFSAGLVYGAQPDLNDPYTKYIYIVDGVSGTLPRIYSKV